MTDITVPQLGESISEATVGAWAVAEGAAVKRDDLLVELETDKVSVEVRAEADGVLTKIAAQEGETVGIGAKLGELGAGEAKAADKPAAEAKPDSEKKPEAKADGEARPDSETKSEAKPDAGLEPKSEPAPTAKKAAPSGPETTKSDSEVVEASIPEMGESVSEGTVGAWLVDVGAAVKKDQALVEIETDKVAVEVPAPADGVLAERLAAEGEVVKPGDAIARIRTGGEADTKESVAAAKPAAKAEAKPESKSETKAMPSAERKAKEEGVNLAGVAGSGKDGRVTKGDVIKAAGETSAPAVDTKPASPAEAPRAAGPREERVKMTRLRQTIARRLKEAQNAAAMLTTFNEADMSAIMAARKANQEAFTAKHSVKLGFMSFFVKAVVAALKDVPAVNAEIDGTDLVYKNYYDIGVAVGTDRGLVVPVVRDCDVKSLAQIEKDILDLGLRARDGKLSIDDMQGATFTISNGGVYGSLLSTPILNAPQSGILGMHKIQERPVAEKGQVVIRPMMYLALSYDHRIVDGKEAVTFLVRVKEGLEDPQRLLFDI